MAQDLHLQDLHFPDIPFNGPSDAGPRFLALLRGDLPLAQVTWIYGFAGSIILAAPINFINAAAIEIQPGTGGHALFLAYCLFLVTYAALVSVGMWRAAGRFAGWKLWALSARLTAALVLATLAAAFLIGLLA